MHVAGLIILQPWFQIQWIFKLSKWYAIKEKSKIETRSFALGIIEQKISEHEANVRSGNNNEQNPDDYDFVGGPKKQLNFIDECVRLSLDEKCFSREDMVNESVTMLLGVSEYISVTLSAKESLECYSILDGLDPSSKYYSILSDTPNRAFFMFQMSCG